MRAGKLRHRLDVQAPEETQDTFGAVTLTWRSVGTVWGSVEAEGGQENWRADKVEADRSGTATIRYYPGLTSRHRLVTEDGRILNVVSAIDREGRRREMTVSYREEV